MIPEHKTAWLAALRSGKYHQAFGVLVELELEDCFCAIGLGHQAAIGNTFARYMGNLHTPEAYTELGLTDSQALLIINLNDRDRLTFPEIADWIETHVATS